MVEVGEALLISVMVEKRKKKTNRKGRERVFFFDLYPIAAGFEIRVCKGPPCQEKKMSTTE